jgi:Sulfotransferase family
MPAQESRRPLHERLKALRCIRGALRSWYYSILKKAFGTDDGKAIVVETLRELLNRDPGALLRGVSSATPYPNLGGLERRDDRSDRRDVVIITGRFRSGSTLLWNLFRRAGGFTAYYEPFNERRWFDPKTRGAGTDFTHRDVSDYWREYDGLEVLGQFYREDWIRRHLLMDEHSWAPEMKKYVDTLIDRAPGRPVLQFNRIDFRLPWFRRNFPNATYIHIFRHPRDQWCSTLQGDVKRFSQDASIADFHPFDKFYLRMWAEDLKYHFPFLEEKRNRHPYQVAYYIWKLSYLFGVKYCDHSIPFEALLVDPDEQLRQLFRVVDAEPVDLQALKRTIVGPPLGKWREYADEAWFQAHEASCEAVLADFLGLKGGPGSMVPASRTDLASRIVLG